MDISPERIARGIDFAVIGAMRSGTTTLWELLRSHPGIFLPADKEAAFFSHPSRIVRGVEWYLREFFPEAPADALWGSASPQYMRGQTGMPTHQIPVEMARLMPHLKLVAVLRDPIDRARSQYRFTVRRGHDEPRSFAEAMEVLLDPAALKVARKAPTKTNTYLVCGEYGRILSRYARFFPPGSQLHVILFESLIRKPHAVTADIFAFLGVEPLQKTKSSKLRLNQGGTRFRVSEADAAELANYLREHVFGGLDAEHRSAVERGYGFWFRTWNVVPQESESGRDFLPPELIERLEAHFAEDAQLLQEAVGISVPWAR